MATGPDDPPPGDVTVIDTVPAGRRRARAALKWTGIVLAGLIALLLLFWVWLNSDFGRRFVVKQINGLEMASGLNIQVGSIEGSLFGELTIRNLTLADPKGRFFAAPEAKMDWRPLAYFSNHIDIRSLDIPQARLWRLPELKPGDPNAPMLPDINADIGHFSVGRIYVDPAVTGYRHLLNLDGTVKIASRRAQVGLAAKAIAGAGLPGGDKLVLRLDAVPDRNRLDMGLQVDAPANGFVASLSGLSQPLSARVNGRGGWDDWNGRAIARLGGKDFLDLGVNAKNGTFTVRGPVSPGLLLADGPARRLVEPGVQVDLVTTLAQRRADTRLRLSSPAMSMALDGLIDLGRSEFGNVRVAARLAQPGAIAPNLAARNLQLAAVLNGPFKTPFVAYDLSAAALGFNGTTVEGLRARGRAKVDSDHFTIPVSARATRISGLDPSLGGLLTHVAVDGTLNVSGTTILSDDLRIRSDRLNATTVIVADLARGQYRAGIQGTVNGYHLQGVGLLDINTHMDVVATAKGFGLKGRVAVKTRRIDNASAAGFLQGNATAAANVVMDPSGVIRLSNVRLSSPGLRITSGDGTYWPDGRIHFRLAGVSRAYGPLAVVLTGTATRPQVQLRAARPGFGIGLRDISATVRATAAGYVISATGQSDYGPFAADVTILAGRGPMAIDIRRLTFAGMTFAGRVVQTAAGPFAGTLSMSGQGLNGVIHLAAAGRYQQVQVSARASGATVPGPSPILIQRGIIEATAILYPGAPQVVGDVQVAGVRASNFFLGQARARVNYQGGRGTAQLFAEGTSGVPFRVGINAAMEPDHIRAAAQGIVNRIPFRLSRPADLRKVAGAWQLAPTKLVLPQGGILVAGRYGNGMEVQARLENLDISILNVFSPGLGLSGRANGSIDFAQASGAAIPRAEARLTVAGFSRTGIAVRSPPVDLALLGTLGGEGGALNAVIRRQGALIGRAQLRLQPLGGGDGWVARLMSAPLAGGIRYNGPADVLWSFSGIADQHLSGPIGVAADFSGRVDNPQLTGVIRANNLTYTNESYGTRITNLALQGRFTRSTLEITQLSGKAGRGTISGHGTVGFAAASGFPMDIRLTLNDAQLARSDNLGATLTGELAVTNSRANGALIAGDLQLPNVRYQIIRQGAAQIVELVGVRRKGEPLPDPAAAQQAEAQGTPSIWKLDLRLRAQNQVFVAGMGLESEWSADLRVQGTTATPQLIGEADLIRGTYSFSGQRFDVTRGHVQFTGQRPPNPRIDLVATANIKDVDVSINIGGSATNPQIAFTSSPALPQDEIMARILFGGSVSEISALQAVQLASSLNALRGGGGGLNPLGKLRSATGLSRLRVLGADETTGRGTAVAAGFYIGKNIYMEVITDARGYTATQLEIALSKALSALSSFSPSGGGNNVSLRYRKQY
ncbi:MAG: translocation/assembly module TamB domain-containing protein [Alphaproteobacteria bacterium]|nr:translocation/assembly module TamB domain-containing protein [Alphaproteobacteria bacterium]MBV9373098.1 translocation/assembly module TamB domain-containing protein [Alphaproteobacteria bacterium]MBV9902872.1 translocation/assembly module TamB domain-containing protein [Alphaproteobacteria bacterium]